MSTPTIGIVTVSYNGLDHLQRFVPALLETDYPRGNIRLLVVDNASSDGTEAWLRERSIETLRLDENRGFAYPNNLGIQHLAECEFIALLNNDTSVEPRWLSPLVNALEADPTIAMAGAILANWNGDTVDFSGGVVSYTGHAHHLKEGEPLPRAEDEPSETLFVVVRHFSGGSSSSDSVGLTKTFSRTSKTWISAGEHGWQAFESFL